MKKILIILAGLFTLLFYGCGSNSGSSVANQLMPEPIFSQEEQDIFKTSGTFGSMKSVLTVSETIINNQSMERYFTSSTLPYKFIVKIVKKGDVYGYNMFIIENNKQTLLEEDYDLNLKRLLELENNYTPFTSLECSKFSDFSSPLRTLCNNTNIDFNHGLFSWKQPDKLAITLDKVFSITSYTLPSGGTGTSSETIQIYAANILKENNKYYYIDKDGIVFSSENIDTLLSNKTINDKLTKFINENKGPRPPITKI